MSILLASYVEAFGKLISYSIGEYTKSIKEQKKLVFIYAKGQIDLYPCPKGMYNVYYIIKSLGVRPRITPCTGGAVNSYL